MFRVTVEPVRQVSQVFGPPGARNEGMARLFETNMEPGYGMLLYAINCIMFRA